MPSNRLLRPVLDDDELFDATELARALGCRVTVHVSKRLWTEYIIPPESIRSWRHSESSRFYDLLEALHEAVERKRFMGSTLTFNVGFWMEPEKIETVGVKMEATLDGAWKFLFIAYGTPKVVIHLVDEARM